MLAERDKTTQRSIEENERLRQEIERLKYQMQSRPDTTGSNMAVMSPSEEVFKRFADLAVEAAVRKDTLENRDERRYEQEKNQREMQNIHSAVLDIQKQLQQKAEQERLDREKKERELDAMKKAEADLYGKFDLSKVKDLDLVTNVPRYNASSSDMAFLAQPDQYTRELSRADKALLLQAGIKGLLDRRDDGRMFAELPFDQVIRKEIGTNFKATNFVIQFLAIRPSHFAVAEGSIKVIETSQDKFILPKHVYFTFNFFDFSNYKTDSISLEKADGGSTEDFVAHSIPYYLVKETYSRTGTGPREPVYKYEIDPSLEHQSNQHLEFAKYLYSKSLHIDIWDADSLLQFGAVKVPLHDLLRQGKDITTMSKEFDIIEPNFMRIKGGLQILLKNIGKETVKQFTELKPKHLLGATQNILGSQIKKKVKSKNGIDLSKELKQHRTATITHFDNEAINNAELRKQERINRYKISTIENKGGIMEDQDRDKYNKHLREITNFRDTKKPVYLKSVLHHHYDDEKVLNAIFGKVEVFSLEITNFFEFEEAFTVIIEDPDSRYLSRPELTVVSNPSEWKYWVEKKGFARPPEWNMISPTDNNLILKSGEKVEVVFKYLTTRVYDENTESKLKGEVGLANLRDVDNRKQYYLTPRTINITASQLKGRVITGVKVNVEPHAAIVDHVFRFYEQENRNVTLYLPALYASSVPPSTKPILALTNPKAVVDWLNDKEISLQLKVGAAQSVTKFNILAYADSYRAEILGNFQIEIHSFAG